MVAWATAGSGTHGATTSATASAALGHAIHYGVLAIGLAGVAVLLVPTLLPPRPEAALTNLLLPVVAVSSGAAAGVHAAVCPAHLAEATATGLFFAGAALGQLAWTVLALRRPTRPLLVAGIVGNVAVLVVWALSRSVGLPVGPATAVEPVGAWDLAAGLWEGAVVSGCAVLLLRPEVGGGPERRWHPAAQAFFAGSAVLLGILSFSGAGA
jgi:hypothetical protein